MARYFINGGINNNWGDTSNWSTVSNGAGGASVPTSSDDVYLDAFSPDCNLNTSNRVAKNFDCTGYTNTFAMSTLRLTLSGTVVTFSPTMTITGTDTIGLVCVTSTITTNGFAIPIYLSLSTSNTFTLADDMYVNGGTIRVSGTTINGNNIYLDDNSTFVNVTNGTTCGGTTNIKVIGDNVSIGSQSTGTNNTLNLNLEINNPGNTVTFRAGLSGQFGFGAKTLNYIDGNINWVATFIRLTVAGTVTFDLGLQTIPSLSIVTGGITISLTSDLYITGTLTIGAGCIINNSTMYIYGLTYSGSGNTTGTTNIIFNGTGTWINTLAGAVRNNITINTSGILSLGTSIRFDTGTLTYTSGTIISSGNTLTIGASTTFNTNGMLFENITFTGTHTITLNSLLSATGTMTLPGANITFAGNYGWYVNILTHAANTTTRTHILVSGVEYVITDNFTITTATNAVRITFMSSTPGTKAIFTLASGATQNVGYTNATDIDSSLGQTIYSFNGVITTTFNWNTLTRPTQKNYIF